METDGLVYVLSNKAMPGIVKIGMTTKTPKERAFQLFSTGVPLPFHVECAVYFKNISEAETTIHERFASRRVSPSREFFRVCVDEAVVSVMQMALNDYSHVAVSEDLVIPDGDIDHYASLAEVHVFSIPDVLACIPPESWRAAGDTHREIVAIRLSEMEHSNSPPVTQFGPPNDSLTSQYSGQESC